MAPQTTFSADFEKATGVEDNKRLRADEDDGSSSLSELGDRAGIEHSSRAVSEVNDTEAETERLEESPYKQRRRQDVVLTSANGTYGDHQNQSVNRVLPEELASPGRYCTDSFLPAMADRALGPSKGKGLEQTSDISSLEDSGEESGKDLSSMLSVPIKRKRSSFEADSGSDHSTMRELSTKAMKLSDSIAAGASAELDADITSDVLSVHRDLQDVADTAMSPSNEEQPRKPQVLPKQKQKKGKRKGKRIPSGELANAENAGSGAESPLEHGGNAEAMYSNEEDGQVENMAESVEAENPAKVEERKQVHRLPWKS